MKIEFSDRQLELLKNVLEEYAEECYHSMFEYQRTAMAAEDETVKKEYALLAQSEEEYFASVKDLSDYILRYEQLMRGRDE